MRIIREFYEQLYANKLDNLGELEKCIEACQLPKLTEEEMENLNRSVKSKEIESVIKKLPTKKHVVSDSFTSYFYQVLKELAPIQHRYFEKNKVQQYFLTCSRGQYYHDIKTRLKQKKKLHIMIPLKHRCKNSQ